MYLLYILYFVHIVTTIPLRESNQEYAIVDFSDVTEHRQRYRRETIEEDVECELKEDCLLPITYKGHQKTLNLTRDEILSPDLIPILKKNGDNLLVVASKTKTDTVTSMYYYEEDSCRFGIMVTCQFSADCETSNCQIRGDLLTDDELIEIAGSVEEKQSKHQKLLSQVPHVVKKIPNTDYKSFGLGDVRAPGKDRNGNADPNLPPILTKKGKLELKDMLSKGAAAKLKQEMEKKQKKQEKREKKKGKKGKKNRKNRKNRKNKKRRGKREADWYQINEDVIQILMTNDLQFFNSFKKWGGRTYTDEEAEILMIEYMTFIAAGIDHRMHNIRLDAPDIKLRVHLAGIYPIIAEEDALSWESKHVYIDGEPHLDVDDAIGNFSNFVYDNRYLFSEIDHVMAITGQDLVRWVPKYDWWEKAVLGYTFSNSKEGILCRQPYYAVSIVEAPAIGISSRIGAHEIAHNLRVGHDTKNGEVGCTMDEQYIMAEGVVPATNQYRTHPYKFSPCSIAKIREHLKGLDALASDPNNTETTLGCMKHAQFGDIFSILEDKWDTGQRYDYDVQCKYLMNDPLSRLCVVPRASYCWDAIYCTWPSKDSKYCYAGYGYNGSPCNSTAVCFEGECVLYY